MSVQYDGVAHSRSHSTPHTFQQCLMYQPLYHFSSSHCNLRPICYTLHIIPYTLHAAISCPYNNALCTLCTTSSNLYHFRHLTVHLVECPLNPTTTNITPHVVITTNGGVWGHPCGTMCYCMYVCWG